MNIDKENNYASLILISLQLAADRENHFISCPHVSRSEIDGIVVYSVIKSMV